MFYIYILQSDKNGSYYVGSCADIILRLKQHNGGAVKSTKSLRPWVLLYNEGYQTLLEARRRELQIKSWKSRRAIERMMDISK
jgi:putative endonuclease